MDLPPEEPKAGAPDWMVTFADLMSLLLTFFVLLLSFANTEVVKFKEAMGSVREAFGLRSELDISDQASGETLSQAFDAKEGDGNEGEGESPGLSEEELEEQLREILEESGASGDGEARITKHGVVLQLSGDLMFDSGAAEISDRARVVLDGLAQYIINVERGVDIIGHTDDVPINTLVYPSNWELSAARAGHAVRYLVEKGVSPAKLRAIGQASFEPISPNDTAENRAVNRRVEFIFTEVEEGDEALIEDLTQPAAESPEGTE